MKLGWVEALRKILTGSSGSEDRLSARAQSGATAIEYGIIAAFVAISIYVGAVVAGNGVKHIFLSMGNQMHEAIADWND